MDVRGSYNVIYIEENDDGLNTSYAFIENAIKTGALIFTRAIEYSAGDLYNYAIGIIANAYPAGDDPSSPTYTVSVFTLYENAIKTYTASDKNSNLVFTEP